MCRASILLAVLVPLSHSHCDKVIKMLSIFISWSTDFIAKKPNTILTAKLILNKETDNPSALLDIDAESKIARITFWGSGAFFAEIIDAHTGENIFSQHGIAKQNISPENWFDLFFSKIR